LYPRNTVLWSLIAEILKYDPLHVVWATLFAKDAALAGVAEHA